ncbi:MAG TPA: TonB-dependent receptor [Lacunisphaera sp.]|nr:TonB-dependent receptor [Lacunisphaera sp.]
MKSTRTLDRWRGGARHLAFAALTVFAASAAFAQQNDSSSNGDTVKLDKFVVTGSYIPAAADERNALPVQVVDTKSIELTGVTKSALDLLRKAVPQIVGGLNIGVENGNIAGNSTNGGSQVALRNTSTLVLIDGQRAAFDPVSGTGGYQFVDLNIIPVSAVDRIEVLTDGASAIYGSDAVSGVVNIILKKNFQGGEVGGSYGFEKADRTGAMYRERSAHVMFGANTDRTNVTVSAEWSKSDPLYERDYSYTSPVLGLTVTYAGVVNDAAGNFYKLNPNLTEAPATPQRSLADLVAAGVYIPTSIDDVANGFDLSTRPTFLGALDKQVATFSSTHKITDSLSVGTSLLYAKTSNKYNLNPQPLFLTINNPSDPTSFNLPGIPITDAKAQVRNRFLNAGNRDYVTDTDSLRGTVQVDGKINADWNWSADALYNTSTQFATYSNQVLNSALVAGIQTGLINFTAINQDLNKLAQAGVLGNAQVIGKSQIIAYDARVNGRLFDLPAGPVYIAAGVGYRKEASSITADKNSVNNPVTGTSAWNFGVSVDPFDASRNVKSMFLEAKIPVTSPENHIPGLYTVSLDGAIRHEIYSDTDDPTVPKVSLRWLPFNDEFALRSTYSKSFSAPILFSLFGPTGSGATPQLGGLTAYDGSGNAIGNFPNVQGAQQSGANPNLRPSKSKNYTVGFIYSPKRFKGFSVSVDYYNIKETDIVGTLATTSTMIQDVEQFGPASIFAPYIHLGNFGQLGGTLVTAPGQLHVNPANVFVDQFSANVASQNQDGMDIGVKYGLDTGYGRFDFSTTWAYLHKFQLQSSPGQPYTEYVGNNGFGTLPKYRSYTTLSWQKGAYSANLANTFIDSVQSFNDPTFHVGSYSSVDILGSMDAGKVFQGLRGLNVTVGINNLFNRFPPTDANDFSDPPADTSIYSSIGRFYYVNFAYRF